MTNKKNTNKSNPKNIEVALHDLPTDANVVGGSAYASGTSMGECEAGLASGVIMGERPTSFRRS